MLRRFAFVFVLAFVAGLTVVAPTSAASKGVYTQNFNDYSQGGFDGFGYFRVAATHLRAPVCSFTFSAKWLAGSSTFYESAVFEIGTITVHLQNGRGAHRCNG